MKLDILFHYNIDETTGEISYIGKEEIKVDTTTKKTSSKSTSSKIDSNPDPIVTLANNKLTLTQGAADLLGIKPDDKVAVKYDKDKCPIIGSDTSFGTQTGNRVTKSLTISYKGDKFNRLEVFGDTFKLKDTDKEGIFKMIGNKDTAVEEVPEELVNINEELESIDELSDADFEF